MRIFGVGVGHVIYGFVREAFGGSAIIQTTNSNLPGMLLRKLSPKVTIVFQPYVQAWKAVL